MEKKLRIVRNQNYVDFYRNYIIFIDGRRAGELSKNSVFNYTVTQPAEIYLQIDWCRSNKIKIDAAFEDDITLEVFPTARGWNIIFILYYITVRWNRYLTLCVK